MSIRLDVDVVQKNHEAEEQHRQQAHERVVDERVQQDENETTTDEHARPAQAVAVVFERSLQDADSRPGVPSRQSDPKDDDLCRGGEFAV